MGNIRRLASSVVVALAITGLWLSDAAGQTSGNDTRWDCRRADGPVTQSWRVGKSTLAVVLELGIGGKYTMLHNVSAQNDVFVVAIYGSAGDTARASIIILNKKTGRADITAVEAGKPPASDVYQCARKRE